MTLHLLSGVLSGAEVASWAIAWCPNVGAYREQDRPDQGGEPDDADLDLGTTVRLITISRPKQMNIIMSLVQAEMIASASGWAKPADRPPADDGVYSEGTVTVPAQAC